MKAFTAEAELLSLSEFDRDPASRREQILDRVHARLEDYVSSERLSHIVRQLQETAEEAQKSGTALQRMIRELRDVLLRELSADQVESPQRIAHEVFGPGDESNREEGLALRDRVFSSGRSLRFEFGDEKIEGEINAFDPEDVLPGGRCRIDVELARDVSLSPGTQFLVSCEGNPVAWGVYGGSLDGTK